MTSSNETHLAEDTFDNFFKEKGIHPIYFMKLDLNHIQSKRNLILQLA